MLKDYERPSDGMTKTERKEEIRRMREKLFEQQIRIREAKLPVIVLVEGWDSAGKGSLINRLIRDMDPRFFRMYTYKEMSEREERYPFQQKYMAAIPGAGKFLFMDGGWTEETVTRYLRREITEEEFDRRIAASSVMERQLRDNGYLLVKLFMNISQKEQLSRMTALRSDRDTEWQVTDNDLFQQKEYKTFRRAFDRFLAGTDDFFPWHIVDGTERKTALYDALRLITDAVDEALEKGVYVGGPTDKTFPVENAPKLSDADLTLSVSEEEYDRELEREQEKLERLQNKIYRKRIPVVLCFEGWDAAGKGGNIRRIAAPLDPRGFDVIPIASPSAEELSRHYLWRFWTRLPKTGHVTIFDRTWYGRVMVERIEGFCGEQDWKRAYGEINEFEKELTDWGAVVLKFWLQIDPETQLQRFTDRQNTPSKQWKITEEDWRNREKWPRYEEAVAEMLEKTGTDYAPWYVIPSVDKKYARLATLRIVNAALEKAVEETAVRGVKK